MKKKSLVILLVILVIVILIAIVLLAFNKEYGKKDVSKEKDYLYEEVTKYLASKEEVNYFLDNKNSLPNMNVENYKVFTSIEKLGIEEDSNKTYVYAYIALESYYLQDGKLVQNSGSFAPYKFTIQNEEIINYEKPVDGSENMESTEKIFPKNVTNKIKKINSDNTSLRLDLEKQVDEYYEEYKVNDEYTNAISDIKI